MEGRLSEACSSEKLKDQPSSVDQVEVEWAIYYVDEKLESSLELIDGTLLTIGRDAEK